MKTSLRVFVAISVAGFVTVAVFAAEPAAVQPAAKYEGKDTLLRPEGYREWVFVGSSSGLRYDKEDGKPQSEKPEYKNVYIDPASYREYVKTKTFPQGTVFALESASGETKNEPGLRGSFQKEFVGLIVAVKDRERFADGWAYFRFTDTPGKLLDKAKPFAKSACFDCHQQKGAEDNLHAVLPGATGDLQEMSGAIRRRTPAKTAGNHAAILVGDGSLGQPAAGPTSVLELSGKLWQRLLP